MLHASSAIPGLQIRVCSRDFNPVLYVREKSSCLDDGGTILFDDDGADAACATGAEITKDLEAGDYWIVVDSKDSSGEYELTAVSK